MNNKFSSEYVKEELFDKYDIVFSRHAWVIAFIN